MSAIPDSVLAALVDAGKVTPDRIGRNAQLRTCPRCRQWVLIGYDRPVLGIRRTCDPVAVDYPLGEALALLSGRATVELWDREMNIRDQWNIAGGAKMPIVAEHECGVTKVPSTEIIRLFVPRKAKEVNADEKPPF